MSGVKVFKSAASGGADSDNVTIELQVLWGGNPVSLCPHFNMVPTCFSTSMASAGNSHSVLDPYQNVSSKKHH